MGWKGSSSSWRRMARPGGVSRQNTRSISATGISSCVGGAASSAAGSLSASAGDGGRAAWVSFWVWVGARMRVRQSVGSPDQHGAFKVKSREAAAARLLHTEPVPPVRPYSFSRAGAAYSHWPAGVVTSCRTAGHGQHVMEGSRGATQHRRAWRGALPPPPGRAWPLPGRASKRQWRGAAQRSTARRGAALACRKLPGSFRAGHTKPSRASKCGSTPPTGPLQAGSGAATT